MSKDFSEAMSQRSDKQLADILTIKKEEYQPEAVEAAQREFAKRNLNLDDFITAEEVRQQIAELEELPNEEQKLPRPYKILCFLSPILVSIAWAIVCAVISDAPGFKLLSLPLIIFVQVYAARTVREKGYVRMALDMKLVFINSWIFFVVLSVLIFILEYLLGSHGSA